MKLHLTHAERLTIHRRRLGMSQRQMAKRHGVSLYCYRGAEAGEVAGIPVPSLGQIEPFEKCFVLRLRSGQRLAEVAADMGVSINWLSAMERGKQPAEELVSYWRAAAS